MKIVLVGQTYGPANGPGAFASALARGLAAHGDNVTMITPADSVRSTRRLDAGVMLAGVRAWSLAPFYPEVHVALAPTRLVARLLDELAPDVVHVQDHFPLGRAGARACVARGVPFVATNHFVPENITPHVPVLSRSERGRRWVERRLWRMVARVFADAAAITTPTETAAARLRPRIGGMPVRAISCGVDLSRFDRAFDRDATRRELGLDPQERVFVYVGRLDVEKRVEVLVHAIAEVERDLKLLLVGRGQREGALRQLARALGVEARVVFTGFAQPERVAEILSCADCFAMPGDVELQSIATLEAMAAGLPVLAARGGALIELVEEGVHGALFRPNDPGDAAARMRDLLDAPARWPSMSQASRRRAATHDLRLTVSAYRALYTEVVERHFTSASERNHRSEGLSTRGSESSSSSHGCRASSDPAGRGAWSSRR